MTANRLDMLIIRFRDAIPTTGQTDSPAWSLMYLARSLTNAAYLTLHQGRALRDAQSRSLCARAVQNMFLAHSAAPDVQILDRLPPILSVCTTSYVSSILT